MLRALTRPGIRTIVQAFALLCASAALIAFPSQSVDAGRQGLALCANVLTPSLFPFFVLSAMVLELGMAQRLGKRLEKCMWPLFRVGGVGASALVLGFVGGYPVGAGTAIGLYEKGLLTRVQTERLLAFCNNSGPAFILGVVGAGVFGSGTMGLMLYLAHAAASVCVGLIFRFYGRDGTAHPPAPPLNIQTVSFSHAFTNAMKTAVASMLNICGFVVFFSVAIRLLSLCGAMDWTAWLLGRLGFDVACVRSLLTGLLELSSGVISLSGIAASGRAPMAAFMLGWAGLSVHCQVLSFMADSGLRSGTYITGKLLHGVLSALLVGLLTHLFPAVLPVSGQLAQQADALAQTGFSRLLCVSVGITWLLWLLLGLGCFGRRKKRTGNGRRYGL